MTITTHDLVKVYRGRKVVDKVSIRISEGEIVGLLGPNGAGKTTTFYMVTGIVRPNGGEVQLDGAPITRWPMYKRAQAGIGYLPQEASVFRKLSVADNIRLVMEVNRAPKDAIAKRIAELAEEFHIGHILDAKAGVLSGGERRRVEIARSLATEPKFILLDEPFTGIDPVTIEEIQKIISRLKARGIGILITDHNVSATLSITDRNYILIGGKIFAEGTAAEIGSNEAVRKHYLGAQFAGEGDVDPAGSNGRAKSAPESEEAHD
ncbi:MAG: LPS export ABC transporter ATP-binding protein [Armatimonadetes bacterium]|nr:LPS export ABC transporter ATP-binding protein [Armatimonadota bacterium]